MAILKKIKRELVVILSKLCLKSASNDYFGLDLKYPIVQGMGRGYVIPKEAWMGQCLRAFVETKKGCVIDIGVNVGVYLVKLKVISDDIEYFGFEPNAVCNYYTNELIRMNKFSKAKVLPLALSDSYDVKTLYANKLGDKGASLVYEVKSADQLEYSSSIYTVPGDDFVKLLKIDNVAVIKIDVEGAELQVLKGLVSTMEKFRPYFYTEVWTRYIAGDGSDIEERVSGIFDLLSSRNYKILGVTCDCELEIISSPTEFMDQFDANYIFVPEELLNDFVNNVNTMDVSEMRANNISVKS